MTPEELQTVIDIVSRNTTEDLDGEGWDSINLKETIEELKEFFEVEENANL